MSEVANILQAFDQYDTIIIHRHLNPDADAFGSQLGLAQALRTAYPHKQIYASGEPVVRLNWIGEPQANIPTSAYDHALVIVIDTATTARIAGTAYDHGSELIKIDHHPNVEPFGAINWINEHASSCSEMVADLIAQSERLILDRQVAAALYAGIVGDTGRFLFDLTSPHTHEVAAKLLATGIDAPAIGRREDEITPNQAQLISYVLAHATISSRGAGSMILTQADLKRFGVAFGDEQNAGRYLGKLTTVHVWAFFTQRSDGQFRCELRGKDQSINAIAVRHGGGGHSLASGCIAKDTQEATAITSELDDLLK